MRWSDQEKAVIVASQLLAEKSISEIRKLTGVRDHAIRYTLDKALAAGLLEKRCFVNLHLLGYSQFQVYFTPVAEKKGARKALIEQLRAHEFISWAGELGGDYHFGLNLCVTDIVEVAEFLESIAAKSKIRFLDKLIAARLKLAHFGYRFLSPRTAVGRSLEYESTKKRVSIDTHDQRILQALMEPNFASGREIARKLAIPFSTFEYRRKKLEQQGVIGGYYYLVDTSQLGYQSFMLQLRTKDVSKARKKAIYNFCKQHPSAVVYIESIGAWDFEIYFHVAESREIVAISQQMQDEFADVLHSLKIIPELRSLKLREYPFPSFEVV